MQIEKTFWTGGSESTFWVLRILDESDRAIEPHYIVDPSRSSAKLEIRTMQRLREAIEEMRPDWRGRIRDLVTVPLESIPQAPELEAAYEEVRGEWYLGLQYLWLAEYCKAADINGIDLCVGNNGRLGQTLEQFVVRSAGELENYELGPGGDALARLFRFFHLPVIHINKEVMNEQAQARGWGQILDRTWFCHHPVMGRHACGTCRPCVYMMDWGEGRRLGTIGHLRYYLLERGKRALPPGVKNTLRNMAGPGLRRFLRA